MKPNTTKTIDELNIKILGISFGAKGRFAIITGAAITLISLALMAFGLLN